VLPFLPARKVPPSGTKERFVRPPLQSRTGKSKEGSKYIYEVCTGAGEGRYDLGVRSRYRGEGRGKMATFTKTVREEKKRIVFPHSKGGKKKTKKKRTPPKKGTPQKKKKPKPPHTKKGRKPPPKKNPRSEEKKGGRPLPSTSSCWLIKTSWGSLSSKGCHSTTWEEGGRFPGL